MLNITQKNKWNIKAVLYLKLQWHKSFYTNAESQIYIYKLKQNHVSGILSLKYLNKPMACE